MSFQPVCFVPNVGIVVNPYMQQVHQQPQQMWQQQQNQNQQFKQKPKKSKAAQASHRAGDWVCIQCDNLNYGFRTTCNRCKIQTYERNLQQGLEALTQNNRSMGNKENFNGQFFTQSQNYQQNPQQAQQNFSVKNQNLNAHQQYPGKENCRPMGNSQNQMPSQANNSNSLNKSKKSFIPISQIMMPQNHNIQGTVTPPGQLCMPNGVEYLNMQNQQLYQQQQHLINQKMAQLRQQQEILEKNRDDQEEQILKERVLKQWEKSSCDENAKNSSFEQQLRAAGNGFSSGEDNSQKKFENKQPGLFSIPVGFGAESVKRSYEVESSYEVEMGQEANKSTKNSSRQYSSPSNHSKTNLSTSKSNSHRTPEKRVEPFTETTLPEKPRGVLQEILNSDQSSGDSGSGQGFDMGFGFRLGGENLRKVNAVKNEVNSRYQMFNNFAPTRNFYAEFGGKNQGSCLTNLSVQQQEKE